MSLVWELTVLILGFSGDLEIIGGFLGAVTHGAFVEGVLETIVADGIVELLITESHAFSCVHQEIWGFWHGLETTSDYSVGMAQGNRLRTENNGLQSWRADLVKSGAWSFNTQTTEQRSLSCRGLSKTSGQDITQNDLVNFLGVKVDGLEGALYGKTTEFRGSEVRDFSQKRADGGSLGGNDVDGADSHD